MIVDAAQKTHRAKPTIIFEVDKTEFEEIKKVLQINPEVEDKFKIEISGTEIIYILRNADK
jgi:hypothetical protein